MKKIKSISIWIGGSIQSAEILGMYISYDDLKYQATFQYSLLNESFVTLAQGQFTMAGDDYQNWDDSNDSAFTYAANILNLEIVGDYIRDTPDATNDESMFVLQ